MLNNEASTGYEDAAPLRASEIIRRVAFDLGIPRKQRAPWKPRVPCEIGSADGESQLVDFKRFLPPALVNCCIRGQTHQYLCYI